MSKFKLSVATLCIASAFSGLSFAYQTQMQQPAKQQMPAQQQSAGQQAASPQQRMLEVYRQLNLTDAQKQQMVAIAQKYQPKLMAIQQGKVSAENLQTLKMQMAVEFFQVLTDEQKQKLKSMMQ